MQEKLKKSEEKRLIERLLKPSEVKTNKNETAYFFYEIVRHLIFSKFSDVENIVDRFIDSGKLYGESNQILSTQDKHLIYNEKDSLFHVFCRVIFILNLALEEFKDVETKEMLRKICAHYQIQFMKFISLWKNESRSFSY